MDKKKIELAKVYRVATKDVTEIIAEQSRKLADLEQKAKSAKGKEKTDAKEELSKFQSELLVADFKHADKSYIFKCFEYLPSDKITDVKTFAMDVQTKVSRADLYTLEEKILKLDKSIEEQTDATKLEKMKAEKSLAEKSLAEYESYISRNNLYYPSEEESKDGIAKAYAIMITNGKGFTSLKNFKNVANAFIKYYNDFLDIDKAHAEERANVKRLVESWANTCFFNNISFKAEVNDAIVKDACSKCAPLVTLGKKGIRLDLAKQNDTKKCVEIAVYTLSLIMHKKFGYKDATESDNNHKYDAQ